MDTIRFYSVGDEFGEFSNFAAFPIVMDGERWPTSEHYFQAQKFEDPAYQQTIRKAKSPMIAARLGRDRKQKLRRDWESEAARTGSGTFSFRSENRSVILTYLS